MAAAMVCGGFVLTSCDDDDDPVIEATHPENDLVGEYTGTWTFITSSTGDTTKVVDGSMSITLDYDSTQTAQSRAAVVTLHCTGESVIEGKTGVVNVTVGSYNIITFSNTTSTTIGTSGHLGQYDTESKEISFRFANSVKKGYKSISTRILFSGSKVE